MMLLIEIIKSFAFSVNLSSAFSFVKKYWRELLILGLLVGFWIHSATQKSQMAQVYEDLVEAQQAELKQIEKINKEEIARREETIAKFQEQLDEEFARHQKEIDVLKKQKSKRVGEVVRDRNEKPEKVAEAITNIYGFEYVE